MLNAIKNCQIEANPLAARFFQVDDWVEVWARIFNLYFFLLVLVISFSIFFSDFVYFSSLIDPQVFSRVCSSYLIPVSVFLGVLFHVWTDFSGFYRCLRLNCLYVLSVFLVCLVFLISAFYNGTDDVKVYVSGVNFLFVNIFFLINRFEFISVRVLSFFKWFLYLVAIIPVIMMISPSLQGYFITYPCIVHGFPGSRLVYSFWVGFLLILFFNSRYLKKGFGMFYFSMIIIGSALSFLYLSHTRATLLSGLACLVGLNQSWRSITSFSLLRSACWFVGLTFVFFVTIFYVNNTCTNSPDYLLNEVSKKNADTKINNLEPTYEAKKESSNGLVHESYNSARLKNELGSTRKSLPKTTDALNIDVPIESSQPLGNPADANSGRVISLGQQDVSNAALNDVIGKSISANNNYLNRWFTINDPLRYDIYSSFLAFSRENFLWGHGKMLLFDFPNKGVFQIQAHNFFLQVMCNHGIFAVLSVGLWIILLYKTLSRKKARILLLYSLVFSCFQPLLFGSTNFFVPQTFLIFFLMFCVNADDLQKGTLTHI